MTNPLHGTEPFFAVYQENLDCFLVRVTPVLDPEMFKYDLLVVHIISRDPQHMIRYQKGDQFQVGHRKDGDGNQYKDWELDPIEVPVPVQKKKQHELKIWPNHMDGILSGTKTFEIRRNDRQFHVGDALFLREYDPTTRCYTGRYITVDVTHMTSHGEVPGIEPGFVIMSVKLSGAPAMPTEKPKAWETSL